jgi:hypothetical protein
MEWQQKLQALQALAEVSLHMRKPYDWYVNTSMEIGADDSAFLIGEYGNGRTPEEAVNNHWLIFSTLESPKYVVIGASDGGKRRHVRWNGFMWEDVYSEKLEKAR